MWRSTSYIALSELRAAGKVIFWFPHKSSFYFSLPHIREIGVTIHEYGELCLQGGGAPATGWGE